jgi:hypothetical protein
VAKPNQMPSRTPRSTKKVSTGDQKIFSTNDCFPNPLIIPLLFGYDGVTEHKKTINRKLVMPIFSFQEGTLLSTKPSESHRKVSTYRKIFEISFFNCTSLLPLLLFG